MRTQASRLHDLVRRPPPHEGAKPSSWVVSVVSGKGGVGKTNLVLNMGIALAQQGARVLIVDGDLSAANLEVLAGGMFSGALIHVGRGRQSLEAATAAGPAGVHMILAADAEAVRHPDLWPWILPDIRLGIDIARQAYDWLLIDTGPGISEATGGFAALSDRIVVLTTGEPPSITSTYGLIKHLMHLDPAAPVRLMVNGVGSQEEASETIAKLAAAIEHFLHVRLQTSGWVCWDANIPTAVCRQIPFLMAYPDTPASACIRGIVQRLAAEKAEPSGAGALAAGM
jgi:flagellar biosynthesis protein FlhG